MFKLTTKRQAFLLSCVIELPLFFAFVVLRSVFDYEVAVLMYYHIVPMTILGSVWLIVFGHGSPSFGSPEIWSWGFWILVYVIQVVVTVPFMHIFLKIIKSRIGSHK